VDRTQFQAFYDETAAALGAYLRLKCRDATLADDLLQDTYLRLLRRPPPALETAQLRAYLYKTAHSVLVDHYRARQREQRWHDQWPLVGTEPTGQGNLVEFRPTPGPLELSPDMQRVFGTLEPRQQTLLWLAYVEGFKHAEIADVVGVNAASVRVLLSRARAALATRLGARNCTPAATRETRGVKR